MKPQPVVTSAVFPTALAVASISMAILLLPGGGASARPSGLSPALKLVAGDVEAAVQAPIHAAAGTKPKAVVHPATVVASTPSRKQPTAPTSSVRPAHAQAHHPVHHAPVRHSHVLHTQPPPRTTHAAPRAAPAPSAHGHGKGVGRGIGKGKALGLLRKTGKPPTSVDHGKGHGRANGRDAVTHGNSGQTRHGPPVVPPGHAYGKGGAKPALSHDRGGGK